VESQIQLLKMTLETCKKRYLQAKKKDDKEEMELWMKRMEAKLQHPKYEGVNLKEFLGEKGKKK